ncbi:hypothetical protein D3C73_1661350 [compost metagenome]
MMIAFMPYSLLVFTSLCQDGFEFVECLKLMVDTCKPDIGHFVANRQFIENFVAN